LKNIEAKRGLEFKPQYCKKKRRRRRRKRRKEEEKEGGEGEERRMKKEEKKGMKNSKLICRSFEDIIMSSAKKLSGKNIHIISCKKERGEMHICI
jgi:hypothetical protein